MHVGSLQILYLRMLLKLRLPQVMTLLFAPGKKLTYGLMVPFFTNGYQPIQ